MLTLWNPIEDGNGSLVPREFENFFRGFPGWGQSAAASFAPPADVVETEHAFQVQLDMPGHDPKSIEVKFESDTLTVSSERKLEKDAKGQGYLRQERGYGKFARSFVLPTTVDGTRVEAKYENGVLTVTLPKREEAKPKVIEVKVQS